MSFTAVVITNIGIGLALLAILAATMRLPFRIPHPERAVHSQWFHPQVRARARARLAETRQHRREAAETGRPQRRAWDELPDSA